MNCTFTDGLASCGGKKHTVLEHRSGKNRTVKLVHAFEFALALFGLALLSFYAGARLDGFAHSRVAVEEFKAEISHPNSASAAETPVPSENSLRAPRATPVDFELWSATRIAAFERGWNAKFESPIAILRIPKIHLEVPVFGDTGEEALNRGAGWIAGTAPPGQSGNVGIAGHRDGFFRKLRGVTRGDEILLQTRKGTEIFRVSRIEIVAPETTSVLKRTAGPSITLVTCYPFFYVGRAPQRFVVEGHLETETHTTTHSEVKPINSEAETKTALGSNKNMFQGGTHQ
jgi:sortase A